ncbi:extracellular tyrosine-protein kinase PKDCC-like [Cimex lectularius]|uniref:Uncharacterized protein n=1 Tax=Cimex lectularius TaxID=79782 RepID=A0A8I6RJ72_CIMLE|nr:extracellular tyrosine-protein kinase PKDCC-like [Cimex lectularius]
MEFSDKITVHLVYSDVKKVAYSIASLLHHLAHSSLGSLAVTDLKRQQFVLVDGQLKLADVDDLGISEPTCTYHTDCTPPRDEFNIIDPEPVFCVGGRCEGHNERSNILRAGIDFVPHVLPLSAPASLEPHIRQIVEAYQGLHHWDSNRILEATRALITSS